MRKRLTDKLYRAKEAASNNLRREISNDFKYDKKKLRHLTFVLHNVNVSLGALVSALSRFSKLKGPSISPDGMLGGLGYIMPIKDIKVSLHDVIQGLSDIQDTVADELTNPRWNAQDDKEVKDVLKEKEKVEDQVEDQVDEDSDFSPDDVITSAEILEESSKAEMKLASAVKKALLKYGNIEE